MLGGKLTGGKCLYFSYKLKFAKLTEFNVFVI